MSQIGNREYVRTCARRTLVRNALGLGAGALLVSLGVSGCADGYKGNGGVQRVKKSDVPLGGGTLVSWYVVTQPTAGVFHAYYAACPHAGLKVGRVKGQEIVCDHHDARFSISDGSVLNGPATSPLTPAPFTVEGDVLVVRMPGKK